MRGQVGIGYAEVKHSLLMSILQVQRMHLVIWVFATVSITTGRRDVKVYGTLLLVMEFQYSESDKL